MDIEIKEPKNSDGKAGSMIITTTSTKLNRLNMLIWGASGSGKTTLASTAPKPILYIQFDPEGTGCLGGKDDIYTLDLSSEPSSIIDRLKVDTDPASIDKFVKERGIKTIVLDSVTTLGDATLRQAVKTTASASNKISLEAPSMAGYARNNSYVKQCISALSRYTGKNNIHFIVLAHEEAPQVNEKTNEVTQSILIGGKLQDEIPLTFSEVWHLHDKGGKRTIFTRATFVKKPMKSRMFKGVKGDFTFTYDADTDEGSGIADWYEQWVEAGYVKLDLPK